MLCSDGVAAAAAALYLLRLYLSHHFVVGAAFDPLQLFNGGDQFVLFGGRYKIIEALCAAIDNVGIGVNGDLGGMTMTGEDVASAIESGPPEHASSNRRAPALASAAATRRATRSPAIRAASPRDGRGAGARAGRGAGSAGAAVRVVQL